MQLNDLYILGSDTGFFIHLVSRGLSHIHTHQFTQRMLFQSTRKICGHRLAFDTDGVIQAMLFGKFLAADNGSGSAAGWRTTLKTG